MPDNTTGGRSEAEKSPSLLSTETDIKEPFKFIQLLYVYVLFIVPPVVPIQ
jgi:hypothetical protein